MSAPDLKEIKGSPMTQYKPRLIDSIIKQKLRYIGAVVIKGPKHCGKSTTALQFSTSSLFLDNLEKKEHYRILSETEPNKILVGPTPRLLKEWELFPNLWDTVRYEVDIRDTLGQFILTQSSYPKSTANIFHTGTGRFSILKMYPMSLYESGESTGVVSLQQLFDNPTNVSGNNTLTKEDISYLCCRGGWPETLYPEKEEALTLTKDYFNQMSNSKTLKAVMTSFARLQGNEVTITDIVNNIKEYDNITISKQTVSKRIREIKKLFLIDTIPSWTPHLKTNETTKIRDIKYYVDPSIATTSLNLSPQDLIKDNQTLEKVFKILCIRDLKVYAQKLKGEVLYYKDECDAVIQFMNGKYCLIKIESGSNEKIEEAAKTLIKLSNKLDTTKMKSPSFLMVLTAYTSSPYKRKDGVLVVPIGCLKD